jgi:hypothetical protein
MQPGYEVFSGCERFPDFGISFSIISCLYKVEKNLTHDFTTPLAVMWDTEKIHL